MPELAELKFTADYINEVSTDATYFEVEKNPQHKCEDLNIPFKHFKISAESRGKELILVVKDRDSDEFIPIRMTMGMSGYFKLTETSQELKHSHLKFKTTHGTTLSFVDVRRFGKWKQGLWWSENRGPDPTTNPRDFFLNIMTNLTKPAFRKPPFEVLMNQKYFNGIGNYLRAEILDRCPNVNPFFPASKMIANHPEILVMCESVPKLAYAKGGGSIRDWDNPFGEKALSEPFMKCYGNKEMANRIDSNGRRFWYNPKWDISIHREDAYIQKKQTTN